MSIKHPEIKVKLTGTDGNAFAVLGAVRRAMRRAKVSKTEFTSEATSGDYDDLLCAAMRWVDVS